MKILGISAFYHDSAAAIIVDGLIIAAAQEERFTRIKHDSSFPHHAVLYCLEEAGLHIDDLDAIAFYDKPFLKFERLLETYYGFCPKGVRSFIASVPIWVKEKLFLKRQLKKHLQDVQKHDAAAVKLLFPEHHLSHAASAFYPSPYESSAILTIDGVGEWATASVCQGDGKNITVIKELRFPHSLGLLYSSFTYFLGFKVNSGEYKLMGLAPYGNEDSQDFVRYIKIIKDHLIEVMDDGSIRLDQKYFNYATGLRMVFDKKWEKLFGFKRRRPGDEIKQNHMDLALAIQKVTEEVVIKMALETKRLTGEENLCLAGGVALNCVANGKLVNAKIFKNIWVQPAAGDAGGALGSALAAYHIFFGKNHIKCADKDEMRGSYLGPEYHNHTVQKMARSFKAPYKLYENFDDLALKVAGLIDEGNVIGWFQGRMEFGPRALGHRSIIGDARSEVMQQKINLKIKYRESFRPFAPSVLEEEASAYFEIQGDSPYMLMVQDVRKERRNNIPANYCQMALMDKLKVSRSDIPAITHVDFSARIQTVDGRHNSRFHQLIKEFRNLTNFGLIINTSFNVRGEPIVCTPTDAYKCFMRTEMDYLVINDFLFTKTEQPEWTHIDKWKEEFELD